MSCFNNKFLALLVAMSMVFVSIGTIGTTATEDDSFSGGDGTESAPYIITTAAQLAYLAERTNAGYEDESFVYYKLDNDIDLSDYGKNWNGGKGWKPIGTYYYYPFRGIFDGGGYRITGLFIDHNTADNIYKGLFGRITDTVKNLCMVDVKISGRGGSGGLAGMIDGIGSKIENCRTSGNINGEFSATDAYGMYSRSTVGGMVGFIYRGGSVENCYSNVKINGSYIGGIAGEIYAGTIKNCYSTGDISGNNNSGGIAGTIDVAGGSSSITNCAALNPSVIGNSDVGRLVGENHKGGVILSDNVAFNNMRCESNGDYADGAYITAEEINADGTLGGRFTAENGWTDRKSTRLNSSH